MATPEHFLALHHDYQTTYVGLFDGSTLRDHRACENKQASKQLCVIIDEILQRNNLTLKQCSFLAANQGPGPFTTLRVIIACLNGIAYATNLPIIGVNGIETFVQEQHDPAYFYTFALCNAFCNDVYYAMIDAKKTAMAVGCVHYEDIITMLQHLPVHNIKLVGNSADAKRVELSMRLGNKIAIPEPCPTAASLEAIGRQAYQQWCETKTGTNQLLPLYFKNSSTKIAV